MLEVGVKLALKTSVPGSRFSINFSGTHVLFVILAEMEDFQF